MQTNFIYNNEKILFLYPLHANVNKHLSLILRNKLVN